MKHIIIRDCYGCPYKDHKGSYGAVANIPCCKMQSRKELGYFKKANSRGTGLVAVYDGIIPEWCPLPNLDESK